MNTKLVGSIFAAGLAIAACGSDGDDAATSTTASTSTAHTTSIDADGSTTAPTATGPQGLDASFGKGGVVMAPRSTTEHDRFLAVVEGPDRHVYASGFVRIGGNTAATVTRFTADGKLDATFGSGGTAVVDVAPNGGTAEAARAVVAQADGTVTIATPFEKSPGGAGDAGRELDVALVRLDRTGKLDAAFGEGGIARFDLGAGRRIDPETFIADNSWGLAARDGGYVLFGTTPSEDVARSDVDYALVGVTTTGALDQAFGQNGKVVVDAGRDSARNVKVAPDGSILATGYSRGADEVVSPVLIKTSAKGVLDASFGKAGVARHAVLAGVAESYNVALQGSDYVLAGYGRGANPDEKVDLVTYRFLADGSLDRSFGTDGVYRLDIAGHDDRARNVAVLHNGNILVVGSGKKTADDIDAMVVMLSKDGKPIESFGEGGHLLVDLGQGGDAFFGLGLSADGRTAWLAGFTGATPDTKEQDDSALARLAL